MSDAEFVPQEGPKAFITVWRKVILDPRGFYGDMPATGGFENPLIFLGICALFYFILKVIVGGLPEAINALFLVALAYIFGPGILMLASQFIFQGEGDYEGSLRVCAYAGSCLVLAWVPTLGIIAFVYSFYLVFLGTEKIHKLDTTKAVIVTLVAILVTGAIILWVLGWDRIRRPLF
ncbi:MAG: YIP1 family protein [Deltaproteobacteria bacterium]|nr:YIP1 family protein [Deltaproteobacteria bacterium]